MIEFAVRDTCAMIPADRHATIFDRFYQGESFLTKKHGGAGLGLSITRGLLDLMGGSISLESAPGGGSVFTVIIGFDK